MVLVYLRQPQELSLSHHLNAGDDEPDAEADEQQAAADEEPLLEPASPEGAGLVDGDGNEGKPDQVAQPVDDNKDNQSAGAEAEGG